MLHAVRAFLNTWAARAFFLLLVGVFIAWGVGSDMLRMITAQDAVATVGGRRIELPEAAEAYQRQLNQVRRSLGTNVEPTPEIRRAVADQALRGLILQAAMENYVTALGLVTPDEPLRAAVFAMPPFRGADGSFNRDAFLATLRNNNLSEPRFLQLMRADLTMRQMTGAVRAGTVSPDVLTRLVYAFQHETRVADAVSLPFAGAPPQPEPTQLQLDRWYENHKDQYSTRETRTITAAILAADTVAKDIQITEDDLKAAWEAARASLEKPEKRSVEIILVPDEEKARALAAAWTATTAWPDMQKKAQEAGGSPVELTDATRAEFPSAELADAVFAAPLDTVAPPVKSPLGWHVLKVTKIEAGQTTTFDAARPMLRDRLLAEKAADLIDQRANKLDDTLAGGTRLADLPPDLGAAVVTFTATADGLDPQGKPVAIPGGDALRAALLAEAFRVKPGEPPHLIDAPRTEGAPQAYYAVSADNVVPPAPRPMAEVAAQVRADWTQDAIRHNREEAAAALLAAVKGGKTLADAATAAGLTLQTLPPAGRASETQGVPLQLVEPLFGLKIGEPTMIETADGFMVATLVAIREADPDADPIGYGQVRDALARSRADDIQAAVTFAIRDRADARVNRSLADRIAQPE